MKRREKEKVQYLTRDRIAMAGGQLNMESSRNQKSRVMFPVSNSYSDFTMYLS
jgi:hypothetical protein